jgi:hypothetical protein
MKALWPLLKLIVSWTLYGIAALIKLIFQGSHRFWHRPSRVIGSGWGRMYFVWLWFHSQAFRWQNYDPRGPIEWGEC